MLTLYATPTSLYCAKLRILLRYKGLAWQEVPPPEGYRSAAYRRIVPSGSVPALQDGGWTLSDSEAIGEYLEETHRAPAMLPKDRVQRARVRERARFHDTRLEPRIRALFPALMGTACGTAERAAAGEALSERLAQLKELLQHAPPGKDLTLGDCGYPISFTWIEILQERLALRIDWPDSLHTWSQELMRHSAVADELASYRPAVANWLAGLESDA